MRFDIISAVPKLLISPFDHSIIKRAVERGIVSIDIHDLRNWGLGNNRIIDDYQYGGGAGMVMMPEPLDEAITSLQNRNGKYDEVIYLSPDGEKLNQSLCNQLSLKSSMLLICGHYKGIDDRIRQLHVTRSISIGDYVLSGGELGAAVLVDSIIRLIPGVINDETSALEDSFQDNLLAPPIYTRPSSFKGMDVPEVLLSGHEKNIREWREEQALIRTQKLRPDLLDEHH